MQPQAASTKEAGLLRFLVHLSAVKDRLTLFPAVNGKCLFRNMWSMFVSGGSYPLLARLHHVVTLTPLDVFPLQFIQGLPKANGLLEKLLQQADQVP